MESVSFGRATLPLRHYYGRMHTQSCSGRVRLTGAVREKIIINLLFSLSRSASAQVHTGTHCGTWIEVFCFFGHTHCSGSGRWDHGKRIETPEDAGPKRGGSNDDLPVRRVWLAVDRLIDFRSVAGWPSVSAAAGAGAAVFCAPGRVSPPEPAQLLHRHLVVIYNVILDHLSSSFWPYPSCPHSACECVLAALLFLASGSCRLIWGGSVCV